VSCVAGNGVSTSSLCLIRLSLPPLLVRLLVPHGKNVCHHQGTAFIWHLLLIELCRRTLTDCLAPKSTLSALVSQLPEFIPVCPEPTANLQPVFLPYRLSIETSITDAGFDIIKGTYLSTFDTLAAADRLTRFAERQIEFHPEDENLGQLFGYEAPSLKGCVNIDALREPLGGLISPVQRACLGLRVRERKRY
jgi:hypothetical protein